MGVSGIWAVFITYFLFLFRLSITNNPIESYNSTIKRDFTDLAKFNLIPAFECFQDALKFESRKRFDFKLVFIPPKHVFSKAQSIQKKMPQISATQMNYIIKSSPLTNGYNQILTVDIEMIQCDCYTFLEKSMCQHLIAGCLIVNKEVPGVEIAVIIF